MAAADDRLRRILADVPIRVGRSGLTLLLIGTTGTANIVAQALDESSLDEPEGTVAGDNTVLVLFADEERLGRWLERFVAFDMGGTTAKTSLIRDSEPVMAPGYYVGGYASGHPVMVPVVDLVEVGAGGGSIAWIDDVGALKVGPHSAGAEPGPICYSRGGSEPTITDANVVLGRLDPLLRIRLVSVAQPTIPMRSQ
mgnify:CR=1 FL=1